MKAKKFLKVATLVSAVAVLATPVMAFAEETGGGSLDFGTVTSAISGTFSASNAATIIAAIVTAGGAVALTVTGSRKIVSGVQTAFRKGRVRV